jgi:hypothetical protein
MKKSNECSIAFGKYFSPVVKVQIKIGNKYFANVAQFRYLGTTNKSKPDSGGN